MTEVAIIGGGASACLLLANWAQLRPSRALKVSVFDGSGDFARGLAYRTDIPELLVNVRANRMSALANDPDDFVRWIHPHGFASDAFAPRQLYGCYLQDHWRKACESIDVQMVSALVLDVGVGQTRRWKLRTENGVHEFERVVLATGNAIPNELKAESTFDGYRRNPWKASTYDQLPDASGTVAILGAGLTAVDAIVALHARDYRGHIRLISRHGRLPEAQLPQASPTFAWRPTSQSPRALLREVCEIRARADSESWPWQCVIDGLREHTNPIWQQWSARQQSSFLRHGFSTWNRLRHRMPDAFKQLIDTLRASDRISHHRDVVLSVNRAGVQCRSGMIAADVVINALGHRPLLNSNWCVDYRIGPCRFGELLETTAIPEIRQQAAEVSQRLYDSIG